MFSLAGCGWARGAPHGFRPDAFSAVSRDSWWVLGLSSCGQSGSTCSSLIRTTDNGRTFTVVPVPASTFSGVAFANRDDGYLLDQAGGIWTTRDAGRRWKYSILVGTAEQVITGRHYAYATVITSGSGFLLTRSVIGGSRWETVPAAGDGVVGVSVLGDQLLVSTAPPLDLWSTTETGTQPSVGGQILRSTDGGSTFSSQPEPTGVTGCLPEQPTSHTIWLLCSRAQTDWYSSDAGVSYAPLTLPAGIGWFNSVQFFDREHGLAYGGPSEDSPQVNLYRTDNAGATYQPVRFR